MTTSATEFSTAVTDVLLAALCIGVVIVLSRTSTPAFWKRKLWTWLFGLLSLASGLGFVVHGLALPASIRSLLWHPLYMALALVVALFATGAVCDLRGERIARMLLPWLAALGLGFYGIVIVSGGDFRVFIAYEAVAMLAALGIYTYLAIRRRLPGTAGIAAGIVLNLAAATIQASDLSLSRPLPLDHNGLFHMVQIIAICVLAPALRSSLLKTPGAVNTLDSSLREGRTRRG